MLSPGRSPYGLLCEVGRSRSVTDCRKGPTVPYAHDDYSPGSDIDIAIIADNLPSDPGKRFAMLKDTVLGLDLQPFAYTTEEWGKMLETDSSFASEIVKYGKVLLSEQLEPPRGRKTSLQAIAGSKTISREDWQKAQAVIRKAEARHS